jgi:hypothetical protein
MMQVLCHHDARGIKILKFLSELCQPQFAPQIIQARNALEDVMTRVPHRYLTTAVKVYLAECIEGSGSRSYELYDLIVAAADQIQASYRCLASNRQKFESSPFENVKPGTARHRL